MSFWVYRCFEDGGQLLYVGMTGCGIRRLHAHGRNADWWASVARIEVDHFETAQEASDAEREAIRDESPRFNVQRPLGPSETPKREISLDGYLSTSDLAEWLGVERAWVHDRQRDGMPSYRIGGAPVFKPYEVREWLFAQRIRVPA